MANRIPSNNEATVSTPPMIAHVLRLVSEKVWKEDRKENVRCNKMSEGLSCVGVYDKDWRNFEIEECA